MDRVKVSQIRIDGGTQLRHAIDTEIVAAYAEALAELPPVVVFHDGTDYWLADGFHRYHAHRKAECATIDCEIHKGTQRDAVLYAAGANAQHGLRRTNEDKRKAVAVLLADEEWRDWADREIARRCCVGHPLVAAVRSEIHTGRNSSMDSPTDSEPAPRTFTHPKTGKPSKMKPRKPAAKPKETPPPAQQEPAPPPDPQSDEAAMRTYNSIVDEAVATMRRAFGLMLGLTKHDDERVRLFAHWIDAKQFDNSLQNFVTTFEKHRVVGWASKRFTTENGGRNFVYEREAKKKGALAA